MQEKQAHSTTEQSGADSNHGLQMYYTLMAAMIRKQAMQFAERRSGYRKALLLSAALFASGLYLILDANGKEKF